MKAVSSVMCFGGGTSFFVGLELMSFDKIPLYHLPPPAIACQEYMNISQVSLVFCFFKDS